MIRNILLGYDGSESAAKAMGFALDMARNYSADVHVVAVVRPPDFGDDVETEAILEDSWKRYDEMLRGVREKIAREAVTAHFEILGGHPAEQLGRYAEGHQIDHIVVGHRGRTLFERWLIGSVARQVIAYAPCAVTVVRQRRT